MFLGAPVLRLAGARAQAVSDGGGTVKLSDDLFVLRLPGEANIVAQTSADGVVLVDGGSAGSSDAVMKAVAGLPGSGRVHTIFNTHWHPEQTGSNERLGKAGAAIIAHESVLRRMTEAKPALPFPALPTETYFTDIYKLSSHFNGEGIQLIHMPAAHTDGDSMVWFRGSDAISTGDVFSTETYPIIELDKGGSINGVIEALNDILDLAFPEFRTEGGTMIVPGHGRISDSADVAYYRDMVTIIRDRIQDMIKKGMTLEQVKAAKPTLDYDTRYDSSTWTKDMFVTAVYQSLNAKK